MTIRETDTDGLFVETSFHETVAPVNDTPVITNIDPGAVDENDFATVIGSFYDADEDDNGSAAVQG